MKDMDPEGATFCSKVLFLMPDNATGAVVFILKNPATPVLPSTLVSNTVESSGWGSPLLRVSKAVMDEKGLF